MLEVTLLLKMFFSLLLVLILIISTAYLLNFLKHKAIIKQVLINDDLNKIKLLDKFYIDSKNKIVKIKDGNKILTIFVGTNVILLDKEVKKESESD